MMLETVRVVADWLSDATYGVNALRSTVPTDTGVTAAPALTVFDSTRDGRVARGGVPQLPLTSFPCLLVTPADQPADQVSPAVRPTPADLSVTVLVRYATIQLDTALAERDTSQTLRAIQRSLGQLFVTSAGESARSRAQVQVISYSDLRVATLYESMDDATVTGGVSITLRVRDLWATA